MTALESIIRGRAFLLRQYFFFGSLALRLKLSVDPDCQTAWTDGEQMGFNPDFALGLTTPQMMFVVAHEVLHCAMLHPTRRANRDPRIWNIAADYAVNGILIGDGLTPPPGVLHDAAFRGKSAEDIYEILTANAKKSPAAGGAGSGDKPSDGKGADSDPGRCGEVRDAKSGSGSAASEADRKRVEAEWKIAVSQAAAISRGAGALGAGLEEAVKDILAPEINWRAALHHLFAELTHKTETWSPVDRRNVYRGVYLPGMGGEELGHIVVAVDCSGSIYANRSILDQFAAEIRAIRADTNAEITVAYFDSAIRRIRRFTREEEIEIEPIGGGGTDFRPIFQTIEDDDLRPTCLIVLTDLMGTMPSAEPGYPVIWAATGNYRERVPFGETIRMK